MKNKKMFIKWKGLLFTILWVISLGMFAQNITVRGTVTDENNEPVIGATVLVKGTSMGTVTDVKGNYTLDNVPINGTLEFSYVGMKTKVVNVNGKTTINVVMEEDVIGLEEVVAIGYGTMRRSDLTGAVATANMKALENSPNVNILQSIICNEIFKDL